MGRRPLRQKGYIMENSITITKTREESKLILKNMPKAVQAACDKIFVAGADFGGAIMQTNEKDRAFRLALLDASNAFGKPGKDSPFKGFGEFACAVFGFTSTAAVTNAVKVAESIDVPNIPKLGAWYSTSQLYELRGISPAVLTEDVKSGLLHAGMTTQELREYRKAHELDDGKPKLAKLYDGEGFIFAIDERDGLPYSDRFTFYGVTEDELRVDLVKRIALFKGMYESDADAFARGAESDRFGTFNPHADNDDGKTKTKGKGVFFAMSGAMASATYFATKTTKTTKSDENAATIAAQNATIEKLMQELAALKAAQNK